MNINILSQGVRIPVCWNCLFQFIAPCKLAPIRLVWFSLDIRELELDEPTFVDKFRQHLQFVYFLAADSDLLVQTSEKARYAKLIGSVGKRNQRIKNEIRVDPFVTSRCVSIDSRQMICESIGPKRLIDKFPRETVFYDKGQKLCRADCICLRIVNLPNAFESNIQFVEKNAMIGNYEFDTANVTASDGLNSLSFVECLICL